MKANIDSCNRGITLLVSVSESLSFLCAQVRGPGLLWPRAACHFALRVDYAMAAVEDGVTPIKLETKPGAFIDNYEYIMSIRGCVSGRAWCAWDMYKPCGHASLGALNTIRSAWSRTRCETTGARGMSTGRMGIRTLTAAKSRGGGWRLIPIHYAAQ